jgi:hypothetical protein
VNERAILSDGTKESQFPQSSGECYIGAELFPIEGSKALLSLNRRAKGAHRQNGHP